MKIGILTVLFGNEPFDDVLKTVSKAGIEAVELGTGNYPGDAHLKIKELLDKPDKIKKFKEKIAKRDLVISALSCHGNPLHPDPEFSKVHHEVHRDTVKLAQQMEVETVINFSGCPGGCEGDKMPNWVTCPWPDDFSKILEWQWDKKVIPYWSEEANFAKDHGIKLAFEMHPGFVVYNTETLLRLREECGDNIGANFDPSHLFWQGMDPIASLRMLKNAVYHVHAKDTKIDEINTKINGVLDNKPYTDVIKRSWVFRTVGYGHSEEFWRDFVSTLSLIGYDGVLSIEHEDSLMSVNEGLNKAVDMLKKVIISEKAGKAWWV